MSEPEPEEPQDEELRRKLEEISGWDQTVAGVRAFAGATAAYYLTLRGATICEASSLELTCTWVSATIAQSDNNEE